MEWRRGTSNFCIHFSSSWFEVEKFTLKDEPLTLFDFLTFYLLWPFEVIPICRFDWFCDIPTANICDPLSKIPIFKCLTLFFFLRNDVKHELCSIPLVLPRCSAGAVTAVWFSCPSRSEDWPMVSPIDSEPKSRRLAHENTRMAWWTDASSSLVIAHAQAELNLTKAPLH